jgi:hypothetical protein
LEVFFSDGNVTVRPGTLSLVSDGSLTSTWNRRGKTDNLNLKRLLLLQFLSLYNRPSIKIQGTLHQSGKQILPFNTIQDNSSISTRKYVMQQWEMGLSNGMGNVVYRELIPDDATVTYSFRLSEFGVVPIDVFTPFFPFIPNVPEFTIPNLNGDISGQFGVNNANPSLIVQKPELTIGTLKSSEIVLNAVEDSLDISELSKTTPKALFNAWAVKATPIATDKIVIIDSADSDELKVVTGVPLTMLGQGGATTGQAVIWDGAKWAAGTVSGSKWTEVSGNIYRNSRVTIGQTTIGTATLFVQSQYASGNFSDPHFDVRTSNNLIVLRMLANQMRLFGDNFIFAQGGFIETSAGFSITAGSGGSFQIAAPEAGRLDVGGNRILNFLSGNVSMMNMTRNLGELIWRVEDLPTSDPLVANRIWNNGGVLTVSAG